MDPVLVASDVSRHALELTLLLSLPLLLVGLVVGIIISILQAATQVQEQTLSFIPKILAMFGALYFLLPFFIKTMVEYSRDVFLGIQSVPY